MSCGRKNIGVRMIRLRGLGYSMVFVFNISGMGCGHSKTMQVATASQLVKIGFQGLLLLNDYNACKSTSLMLEMTFF
jgi:glucose uptake protein GlcU